MDRRRFLAAIAVTFAGARVARGQDTVATMFGPMDQTTYRPVRRAPRAGAARLTAEARDALERDLKCQCGCTLDVYTCRTTDFSCPVSPAMHRDVLALVDGGYTRDEISDAFVEVYGERVLMAPTRAGFNLVGYVLPFAVLAGGAAAVTVIARRWSSRRAAVAEAAPPREPADVSAEDMARIERAVRDDE